MDVNGSDWQFRLVHRFAVWSEYTEVPISGLLGRGEKFKRQSRNRVYVTKTSGGDSGTGRWVLSCRHFLGILKCPAVAITTASLPIADLLLAVLSV